MASASSFSITRKVNLLFLLFALLLLPAFIVPAYFTTRKILEKNAVSRLEAISLQKRLNLEGWISSTASTIEGIASTPHLRDDLTALYSAAPGSRARQQALDSLTHDLQIWTEANQNYATLTIIDQATGVVLASTRPDEVGSSVASETYFQQGKKSVTLQNPFFSPQAGQPVMRIALPMHAGAGGGQAVLSVRINLFKLIDIIDRGIGANDPNDIYMVNQARQIIVPPAPMPPAAILRDTLQAPAIEQCIQGQNGSLQARNYAGARVITAYAWLPALNACLLVEEQQQAAYADIHSFNSITLLCVAFAVALALLLSYRLSRAITRPIFTLLEHVEALDAGVFDQRLQVQSKDEFGVLARAFYQMASHLSQAVQESKAVAQENLRLYQVAQERSDQLLEERMFFDKLLDTSTSLILILDRYGRIFKHNRALEVITGYCDADVRNKFYLDLLQTPSGAFRDIPRYEKFRRGDYPYAFEIQFDQQDGGQRYIAWSCDALRDAQGQVEYVVCVGVDVTERRRAEEQLRCSERNLQLALAAAPITVYTTDQDLRLTFMRDPHPGFREEDVLGKEIASVISGEPARKLLEIQTRVLQTGMPCQGELAAEIDGIPAHYIYYAHPIFGPDGAVAGLACAGYDVSDLKRTERELMEIKQNLEQMVEERTAELRQSRATLQTMLDAIPESAYLLRRDGTILAGNLVLCERLNTSMDALIGSNVFALIPPDAAASRRARVAQAFDTATPGRFLDHYRGRYYDVMHYPVFDHTGAVTSLAVISIDVTNWKHAEQAIRAGREQLKELAHKVVVAQEDERRRVSRELHDEAGQALTALSISLKLFQADLPDSLPVEKQRLADCITLVADTMERIRVLAQDLRPQALDALGLNDALEGFCRGYARRTGIHIVYQGSQVSALPDITGVSLYRFLQEALTNTARHAQPTRVCVTLRQDDNILMLCVQDDGIGFDPEQALRSDGESGSRGLGLLGMRERIEMLGGVLQIDSQPGRGATLTAMIDITGETMNTRGNNDSSGNRG